ncbi:MAG: hypothetical protein GXP56_09740 [Deltaproteobacteria bacterium]|nr:hypothetical protein [Deltaproteobacteria bacterium]
MDKKKLAAAMAAVFACIKTSEEAALYNAPGIYGPAMDIAAQPQQGTGQNNIWGISGRQNQMQANSMMQLRMFK